MTNFGLSDYDTDEAAFLTRVQEDAVSFKPIGSVVHSYTRPASSTSGSGSATQEVVEYEVYHVSVMNTFCYQILLRRVQATWNDPGFREYHRRMQIFILLYIEAGSYISEDDDAWHFFVLSVPHLYLSGYITTRKQVRKTQTAKWHEDIPFHWVFVSVQILLLSRKTPSSS